MISANGGTFGDGISLFGAKITGNKIKGNLIGTDVTGTKPLGNVRDGVRFQNGAGNLVGADTGDPEGAGNTIAFNGRNGVTVYYAFNNAVTGIRILGNAIFANDALGIDLEEDGVSLNDEFDDDTGSNDLQNFPVITSVIFAGSATEISGTLTSTPEHTFRIEFFSNATRDRSGFGEGESFLLSQEVTTDIGGEAAFSVLVGSLGGGTGGLVVNVTATATDLTTNNTSEFSGLPPLTVNGSGDGSDEFPGDGICDTGATIMRAGSPEPECTLRAAMEEAEDAAGSDLILFNIPADDDSGCSAGTRVCTIAVSSALPVITESVEIDGYSQPGSRENTADWIIPSGDASSNAVLGIELVRDPSVAAAFDGLRLTGGSSTIVGLAIGNFAELGAVPLLFEGGSGIHMI